MVQQTILRVWGINSRRCTSLEVQCFVFIFLNRYNTVYNHVLQHGSDLSWRLNTCCSHASATNTSWNSLCVQLLALHFHLNIAAGESSVTSSVTWLILALKEWRYWRIYWELHTGCINRHEFNSTITSFLPMETVREILDSIIRMQMNEIILYTEIKEMACLAKYLSLPWLLHSACSHAFHH